jgi:hypothetical protein
LLGGETRLLLVNRAADPLLVAGLAVSAVEIINTTEPDGATQPFFAALLMDSLHSPGIIPAGRVNPLPTSSDLERHPKDRQRKVNHKNLDPAALL